MNTDEIEKRLLEIRERNSKVELDKAWETSVTRRIFISLVTYVVASLWLWSIDEENFLLKAIVPTAGYILSTLTIPKLKNWWVGIYKN